MFKINNVMEGFNMGYTHYWNLNSNVLKDEVLEDVRQILNEYRDIVQLDENDAQEPIVNNYLIQFNGIGEKGYETFVVEPGGISFCKTNLRPYDLVVCEVLLVLKHHHGMNFDLDSDGFWVTQADFYEERFDGYWNEALENVRRKFGYEFNITHEETPNGYYKLGIE